MVARKGTCWSALRSFRKELIRAQAAAQVIPLTRVIRASEKSWRAATWLLKNAQPVTDLTEREGRQQQRRRAREIEAQRPTTEESAAEAVEWLDCVSQEIDQRQAAKQPQPLESLAELTDEPLGEKLRRSVEEAAERAGDDE